MKININKFSCNMMWPMFGFPIIMNDMAMCAALTESRRIEMKYGGKYWA